MKLENPFKLFRPNPEEINFSDKPLNLLHPDFIQDPYPSYGWLRENDPCHRAGSGAWILTRHKDIVDALANPDLINSPSPYSVLKPENKTKYVCSDVANNTLPFLDRPKHNKPRKLMMQAFSKLLEQSVSKNAELAKSILAELQKPDLELLEDFATPFAVTVMCQQFGLNETKSVMVKKWTDAFFCLFAQIPNEEVRVELDKNLLEFRRCLTDALRRSAENDQATFFSLLRKIDVENELSQDQTIDNGMLFFSDGIENVDSGIATAVYYLCKNPKIQAELREQRGKVPSFVNEVLRFDSPAQTIARIAAKDLNIAGNLIKKNTPVILALASANRDNTVFDSPDEFDIHREVGPVLSFGRGSHSCIGASLVRSQLIVSIHSLLDAGSNLHLAEDFEKIAEPWQKRPGHRWLKSLPVKIIA